MEWQDKIAIANYGAAAIVMMVGVMSALRIHGTVHGDAARLLRGLSLVSAGWAIHQMFWFSRWWLLANDDVRTQWFLDHSWLLSGAYLMIYIGAIKVAYALYRDNCLLHNVMRRTAQHSYASGVAGWSAGLLIVWLLIFLLIP